MDLSRHFREQVVRDALAVYAESRCRAARCDRERWLGTPVKVRDAIKAMEKDGWVLDRTRGDHRQHVHPVKPEAGTITVPGHPGDDLPPGR